MESQVGWIWDTFFSFCQKHWTYATWFGCAMVPILQFFCTLFKKPLPPPTVMLTQKLEIHSLNTFQNFITNMQFPFIVDVLFPKSVRIGFCSPVSGENPEGNFLFGKSISFIFWQVFLLCCKLDFLPHQFSTIVKEQEADNFSLTFKISSVNDIFWHGDYVCHTYNVE